MSRKLAVVISGAVSLGSYEAGVIYEVLEVIAHYNEKPETNEDKRIEIDVITGASAGGMTACLLAQHLLCSDKTLRDPYENPLYKAWVEDVNILDLLEVEDHMYSLLQSNVVKEIGEKYIQDDPEITENKHPAAASKIQIGIAMSNLNGCYYSVSQREKVNDNNVPIIWLLFREINFMAGILFLRKSLKEFGYTRYKDQFICVACRSEDKVTIREETLLEGEEQDVWKDFRDTNWSELRKVGLSSGAFPFAFRPMKIKRDGGNPKIDGKRNQFSQRTGDYWYVDGGVFENEPIGMAKELVAQIDQENPFNNLPIKLKLFLLISPMDMNCLVGILFYCTNDNERFYLYIAPGNRKLSENPFLKEDEDGNLNLLQIGGALTGSIFQQARFQDWIIKGIEQHIFSITASNDQLLGDVFSAFAGFLEEKFRAYDYNIGRERAREDLENDPNPDLNDSLVNMPAIQWRVEDETSWENAKARLEQLARRAVPSMVPIIWLLLREINCMAGIVFLRKFPNNQLEELKILMREVDVKTRKKIRKQLIYRLDSLLDFMNKKYLDTLDKKDQCGGWLGYFLRKNVLKFLKCILNLTKFILKHFFKNWLERNILDLP